MFIVSVRGHHIIEFGIHPIDAGPAQSSVRARAAGTPLAIEAFGTFRTGAGTDDSSSQREGPAARLQSHPIDSIRAATQIVLR
jgi:hypothetical protein